MRTSFNLQLFILLTIASSAGYGQTSAVTLSRDTVSVFGSSRPITLIVFLQNPCMACAEELSSWFYTNNWDTTSYRLICLVGAGGSPYSRYMAQSSFLPIFPNAEVLFECMKDGSEEEIMGPIAGRFHIKETPGIVIWSRRRSKIEKIFRYDDLFDDTGRLRYDTLAELDRLMLTQGN